MTLTDILVNEAETTYAVAERLFRRVSEDQLAWTPATGTGWMTVGQLLMHCASFGCGKAIRGFVIGDWGIAAEDATDEEHVPPAQALPSVETVQEALELLAADRDLAIASIRAAGESNLLDRRVTAPWGGSPASLFEHLLHIIAHLAQHKGQLFYYLKLMGQDVKTFDLWGAWSAGLSDLVGRFSVGSRARAEGSRGHSRQIGEALATTTAGDGSPTGEVCLVRRCNSPVAQPGQEPRAAPEPRVSSHPSRGRAGRRRASRRASAPCRGHGVGDVVCRA